MKAVLIDEVSSTSTVRKRTKSWEILCLFMEFLIHMKRKKVKVKTNY